MIARVYSRKCGSYRMYLEGDSPHQAIMIVCVSNESIYNVGKEFGKVTQLFSKQKLSRVLCGMALLTKHSRN